MGVRFVYLKPHLTQVGNLKKGKKQSLDLVTKWANSKTAYQEHFNYLCNVNLILWYSQTLSNGWVDLLYSMMKMSSIQSADSSKGSVSWAYLRRSLFVLAITELQNDNFGMIPFSPKFRGGHFYSDISSLARHMFWNLCRPFLIIPAGNSNHKCFPQCESQSWWIWIKTPYNVVNCYFGEEKKIENSSCTCIFPLRPLPNFCIFVWKHKLFDGFSPVIHTKTPENDDENGDFRKEF